ncbi:MAG: RNase H family protein [Candidatus Thermoplasmatota archaeon]|jgi:ribonuclease HI|nr:RNase H family protein [Candidatus Thermoplasmatota archaeon]|tara:strand:- start:3333 stop:3869 length:537 start_codon:yes stop_codon:yes gene_type:complete
MVESPLHIYVDGSCEENRNVTESTPAGWGFCVVDGDSGIGRGGGDVIAERSGPVVTNPSENDYLGAEVGSNNTAELTAIGHAARWILSQPGEGVVVIRGDSQYALNIASGAWRAKANQDLAESVKALWMEVDSVRGLRGEHVRAHRGHRWNERADHLAFRAMQGESPLPLQFWKPGQR